MALAGGPMHTTLQRYFPVRTVHRLSTGLSAVAVVGALAAALFASHPVRPRPDVPIEILRTKPHFFPLPPTDREPPPRQTN